LLLLLFQPALSKSLEHIPHHDLPRTSHLHNLLPSRSAALREGPRTNHSEGRPISHRACRLPIPPRNHMKILRGNHGRLLHENLRTNRTPIHHPNLLTNLLRCRLLVPLLFHVIPQPYSPLTNHLRGHRNPHHRNRIVILRSNHGAIHQVNLRTNRTLIHHLNPLSNPLSCRPLSLLPNRVIPQPYSPVIDHPINHPVDPAISPCYDPLHNQLFNLPDNPLHNRIIHPPSNQPVSHRYSRREILLFNQ
jgi:hypothetical protein